MKSTADKLVDDYLGRLDRELEGFPRSRRRELVEEISGHIAEARAGLGSEDEAGVRDMLERLGEPEEIAAAAAERPVVRRGAAGWKEIGALILLPIGGIVIPVVGWLAGAVLLWVSDAWSTKDKVIGTLLFPGGLLAPLGLLLLAEEAGGCGTVVTPQQGVPSCPPADGTSAWEVALVVVLVLVPIAAIVYLARRLRTTAATI